MKENDVWFLQKVENGILSVSSTGIVINLKTGREIGTSAKRRYRTFTMQDPDTKKIRTMLVHRLVYIVYVGNIPDDMEVDHKDQNRSNNCIKNLEIVFHKENMRRAIKAGKLTPFPKGNQFHKLRKRIGRSRKRFDRLVGQ